MRHRDHLPEGRVLMRTRRSSEIAQPRIFRAAFDICEPAACRIQRKNDQYPDEIDYRQTEAVIGRDARRTLLKWIVIEPIGAAISDPRDNHRQPMDEWQMQ